MVCGNFQLVGLAVEAEAVDWLQLLFLRILSIRGPDESKLNIRVQVSAQVLEWKLEFLDALGLLDCERNKLRASSFVVQLFHALDSWIVQESKEEYLKLACHWLRGCLN